MIKMFPKYPTLVQVCICTFFNASTWFSILPTRLISSVFCRLVRLVYQLLLTASWTTSTFLLSDDPYNHTPLKIGLLGLLGLLGAMLAPLWGRLVDKIVPWTGQMLGAIMCLIAMIIALGAADISIAGVAIPLMLYDCGAQLFVVSNGYRVAGLDAKARARLNSCVLLFMFMGQVSHPLQVLYFC
jgi:hypothetical protein